MMALSAAACLTLGGGALADEWSSYGRDPGGTRFSPLTQIKPENVGRLRPAWTFHTGDIAAAPNGDARSGFETTPLLVDGKLFITTGFNRVIALDPVTGRQLWAFDPKLNRTRSYGDGFVNRGLAFWRDAESPDRACAHRLYEATLDARLLALDASTGAPCADFGANGEVNLTDVPHFRAGWYHMTSPPLVLDGVVVVGSAINDNATVEMPDGVVRAFDARSGRLLWKWEPLQRPAGVPAGAWHSGAANAWSIFSADPQRHLIYVPTGSASPDYYGGLRPGDNQWADSVVALRPKTGEMVWGFQLVHHDLWDYDTAATPLVTTFNLNGKSVAALIAGNKTGMLYVLDPATGSPVLPIQERPVPQSTVEGEVTSPTQPFPVTLPPLTPQSLGPGAGVGNERGGSQGLRVSPAFIFRPHDILATKPAGDTHHTQQLWRDELERFRVGRSTPAIDRSGHRIARVRTIDFGIGCRRRPAREVSRRVRAAIRRAVRNGARRPQVTLRIALRTTALGRAHRGGFGGWKDRVAQAPGFNE